jgi:magnesium-protoporphyrin IX monomethyl ester (oxidative) cyclase
MKQILLGLIAYPGKIRWYEPNGIHLDDLDEEILALMKKSGCTSLNLAIESGDPEMLHRVMGKVEHLDHTVKMVHECHRIGIRTNGYFVIGMPGETDTSIEKSLRFCLDLPLDGLGLAIATPFPGTRMFDECVTAGYLDPEILLKKFANAADGDLLHEPLFETPTMSRERLIWWSNHFQSEFQRHLFRRRPELRVKHLLKKLHSLVTSQ